MKINWKENGGDYSFKFKGYYFTAYWTILGYEAIIASIKRGKYKQLYKKQFKTLQGCQNHLVKRVDTMHGWKK